MASEESNGSAKPATLSRLPSQKDVAYSCGSCGYALNLHSSSRNTANIDSNYRKALKKGVVSFVSIDESRFGHIDELSCFRRRTKLVCRKCTKLIGVAHVEGPEPSAKTRYDIRICALQPVGTPHL